MKYIFLIFLLTGCEKQQPVFVVPPKTVYLISIAKDENVERAYLDENKAKEYIDYYKNHHDYFIQKVVVKE